MTDQALEIILDHVGRQQAKASNPKTSAWVSANAGSGKTHVLSQRVIRLLLSGVRPSSILCLTYTNAAAAEMSNRVYSRLSRWTSIRDGELSDEIKVMEGLAPDKKTLSLARQLFATALETPGGLKIQTIHAFCQSILQQFPLEANVPGHFEPLSEVERVTYLNQAKQTLLGAAAQGEDQVLADAFAQILDYSGEAGLNTAISTIIDNRDVLQNFLQLVEKDKTIADTLRAKLDISEDETFDKIYDQSWPLEGFSAEFIKSLEMVIAEFGKKTDDTFFSYFKAANSSLGEERFAHLKSMFLTAKRQPKKISSLATGGVHKHLPNYAEMLENAQNHFVALFDRHQLLESCNMTITLLVLAKRFIGEFERLKKLHGRLDFHDQIQKTAALLSKEGAGAWVHYKLDQGIDHILVDEAQDTSPEQWDIISNLSEEFFSGISARQVKRTLFAVGDEKQSIYSFQGARPELFDRMGRQVKTRAKAAQLDFEEVKLNISFRSTDDVLASVDEVFSKPDNYKGLSQENLKTVHETYRQNQPGSVEVWESIAKEKKDEHDDWLAPFDALNDTSPTVKLARRISATIRSWIENNELIVEKSENGKLIGRPITPGDILVLVRKRDAFVSALSRELKIAPEVKTAGADRLKLTEHILVEDLMALTRLMLLKQDDLSLAAIIKSPLFGYNEDDLFDLCTNREGNVLFYHLATLAETGEKRWVDLYKNLTGLMEKAEKSSIFEFYMHVLNVFGGRARFLARLGNEASEVMDEFLNYALDFEESGDPGLQSFINTLEVESPEIKRQMEQDNDEVRIMTVHASKGLEAPIVFLIDPGNKPYNKNHMPRLRVLEDENIKTPLWIPKAVLENQKSIEVAETIIDSGEDEYRRLLYVGMTRAADRLIVCGYHGEKKNDQIWHSLVENALSESDLTSEEEKKIGDLTWLIKRFQKTSTQSIITSEVKEAKVDQVKPDNLKTSHIEKPKHLPRPLSPSGASAFIEKDDAGLVGSILINKGVTTGMNALEKGQVVHRLFQYLPSLVHGERKAKSLAYINQNYPNWLEGETVKIIDQVIDIIEDPKHAALFSEAGEAEVSIMGKVKVHGEERAVSGRIDRLVVFEDEVWILDYKTDIKVPQNAENLPVNHSVQMALYSELLKPLYKNKKIRAFLIYTQSARSIEVSEEIMHNALARLV